MVRTKGIIATDRTAEISFFQQKIREAFKQNDSAFLRIYYLKYVESWIQTNAYYKGKYKNEVEQAQKEFEEFVKTEPIFQNVLVKILPYIKENPGIKQTELYKIFSNIPRTDISYVTYFAEKFNNLKRIRIGNTYQLFVAE